MKGFTKDEDRWGNRTYYLEGDDTPYPSVTTCMRGEPKSGIDFLKRKFAAECAIDEYESIILPLLRAGNRQGAIDHMLDAAGRAWQLSTPLGTGVHALAEARLNDWPEPPDYAHPLADALRLQNHKLPFDEAEAKAKDMIAPYRISLDHFFDDWRPRKVWAELTVFNTRRRYAGTLDAIIEVVIDGKPRHIVVDWKTTKANRYTGHGIYPSTACQCAAYRHAELAIAVDGTRMEMPRVHGCYGINILPAKYAVVPLNCTSDDRKCPAFRKFLYIAEVAKYLKDGAKELLGDPVAPPIREITEAS